MTKLEFCFFASLLTSVSVSAATVPSETIVQARPDSVRAERGFDPVSAEVKSVIQQIPIRREQFEKSQETEGQREKRTNDYFLKLQAKDHHLINPILKAIVQILDSKRKGLERIVAARYFAHTLWQICNRSSIYSKERAQELAGLNTEIQEFLRVLYQLPKDKKRLNSTDINTTFNLFESNVQSPSELAGTDARVISWLRSYFTSERQSLNAVLLQGKAALAFMGSLGIGAGTITDQFGRKSWAAVLSAGAGIGFGGTAELCVLHECPLSGLSSKRPLSHPGGAVGIALGLVTKENGSLTGGSVGAGVGLFGGDVEGYLPIKICRTGGLNYRYIREQLGINQHYKQSIPLN